MKIIFKKTNEVKEVAFGYAVNYLIPQGLAVTATEEELLKIKKQQEARKFKVEKQSRENEKRAKDLRGKEFLIKEKVGKSGKLYGRITRKQLAEVIGVDKQEVVLAEPIKKMGEYKIDLKIGQERVKVKIVVEKS